MVIAMKRVLLPLCLSLSLFATYGCTLQAASADESVPVSQFESQVTASLALEASQAGVDADRFAFESVRARSGPELFATNTVGPERYIALQVNGPGPYYLDQGVGVRLPLLGTSAEQRAEAIAADLQRRVAMYDYQLLQNQMVAKVRQNYVAYLKARTTEQTARGLLEELQSEKAASGALQRNGFWTQADDLRYSGLLSRATSDEALAEAQQREALEELGLLTGATVAPFEPLRPEYDTCSPSADFAISSSYKSDPELQKLLAQEDAINALVPLQKVMGIDASLSLSVHGYYSFSGAAGAGGLMTFDVGAPIRTGQFHRDESQRLSAELHQTQLLIESRRHELQTNITVAFDGRVDAQTMLAQARVDHTTIAEDLRETQVRFANVTPNAMSDVQQKLKLAYEAQLALIDDDAAVLQATGQILQYAPNACTGVSAMNEHNVGANKP